MERDTSRGASHATSKDEPSVGVVECSALFDSLSQSDLVAVHRILERAIEKQGPTEEYYKWKSSKLSP